MHDPQRPQTFTDPEGAGWLDTAMEQYRRDPDFIAEGMALRLVTEALQLMEEEGISRTKLGEQMGVTRQRISRLFNAPPNMTLRSIAQLAVALGSEPHVSLRPRCPLDPASHLTIGHAAEAGSAGFDSERAASNPWTLTRETASAVR